MLRKMIILIVMIIIYCVTPTNIWAKNNVTLKDVTGDGKLEKIYVEQLGSPGPNGTVHFRLVIKEKTSTGWQEIFPMYYHCYNQLSTNKALEGTVFSINSDGDFGGYIIGKFTSKYPGQQILIYFPCTTPEERKITYYEGYFFKKELKDKEYTIYRKDVTDRKYKNSPQLHQQLKKEFQKQTRFAKAYKVVCDFWQALKNQDWEEAASFAEPIGSYVGTLINECKQNNLLLETKDLNFYTFNSESELSNYYFKGYNKRYTISIIINEVTFKISVGGWKDGKPFIGC